MTSQPGKQIIEIHILLNISKSKGYQKMKFDQVTEWYTAQKLKFSIKNFFSKCGPIRRKCYFFLRIWLNLLKKSLMENFIFCAMVTGNMRNIFLEKSYAKCDRETIRKPFSKKKNWVYPWVNSLKSYVFFFFFVCHVKGYQSILKLRSGTLAFTSYNA